MEDRKVIEMSKEDLPFIHFSYSSAVLVFHRLLMRLVPYFKVMLLLRQMEDGYIKAGRDTGEVFAVISSGTFFTLTATANKECDFFFKFC